MPEKAIYLTPHYLPCIGYFTKLMDAGVIRYDPQQKFVKQTLRNRTFLLGPHKVERLTIPVHEGGKALPHAQVKIDYSEKWVKNHLKTIENCYRKAPYFEYYYPYFQKVYETKPDLWLDFTLSLLTLCLKFTTKVPLESVTFAENILPVGKEDKNCNCLGKVPDNLAYQQNFGNDFASNVSILDTLFCLGPETTLFLQKTALQ